MTTRLRGDSPVEVGRRSVGRERLSADLGDPVALMVEAMERQGFAPSVRCSGKDRSEHATRDPRRAACRLRMHLEPRAER